MITLNADQLEVHRPLIRRICLRMLGNENDADDATQDTLTRAVSRIQQYRGEASPATWLGRIAQTVCLNHLKCNGRHGVPDSLDERVEPNAECLHSDPMESSDHALYLQHLLEEVMKAARIQNPPWDTLDYLIFETYFRPDEPTWPEIGQILALSPDTAKYRYYHHILPVLQAVGRKMDKP